MSGTASHDELRLLVQADVDGQLEPRDAAIVAAHLGQCPECSTLYRELQEVRKAVRAEAPYHAMPADFRRTMEAMLADKQVPAVILSAPGPVAGFATRLTQRFSSWGRGWREGSAFGAGALLAACLVLLIVLPRGGEDISGAIVDSHVRALQPGHLIDIRSTNQHTVKPWFDGKLDFAPPVKDLAAQGFPLQGGRLDYLEGHPVAALIYGREKHVIDLYVWPKPEMGNVTPSVGSHVGYNLVHWSQGDMDFWAVSDLNKDELAEFVRDWVRTS